MDRRLLIVPAFAIALTYLCGCQQQTRPAGHTTIRTQTPDATLVERADAFQNGRLVAVLRTWRFDDRRGEVTWVSTPSDTHLGYITQDGRAFRATAHDGFQLVANSTNRRQNVAAVLGRPQAALRLRVVAAAR